MCGRERAAAQHSGFAPSPLVVMLAMVLALATAGCGTSRGGDDLGQLFGRLTRGLHRPEQRQHKLAAGVHLDSIQRQILDREYAEVELVERADDIVSGRVEGL